MAEADAGLKVRVINMHTIKPIDEEAVMSAIMDTRRSSCKPIVEKAF